MICPLLKSDCRTTECAWYVKEVDDCIMQVIPGAIMSINSPPCDECPAQPDDEYLDDLPPNDFSFDEPSLN